MDETAVFTPHAWEAFYVIVGSTAGALIGLQFVVLTLITDSGILRGRDDALSAFSSPNVVHFCGALLVSAILSAPWHGLGPPGVAVMIAGVCGVFYSVAVLRRTSRQRDYTPVLEDWIWHAALPMLAYAGLLFAGIQLMRNSAPALFIVGGAALLLVFIGIHNAWDTVTYVALQRTRERMARVERPSAPAAAAAAARTTEPPAPTPPPTPNL